MSVIRLEYVTRGGHRQRILDKHRPCKRTGCTHTFVVTTLNYRKKYCSKSCASISQNHAARKRGKLHRCQGYPGHQCLQVVRHKSRCEPCREKHTDAVAQTDHGPRPGPKMCALPVRGGLCTEVLLFQVNREGRLVTWCPTHGERVPQVIRPGSVGYPQPDDKWVAQSA
jgi:hypothetical protein